MITFYDIPSTIPGQAWSPNTWKARYALNFKGIPYQTAWVEYPDIEATCKKIGALPTSKRADGSPLYTFPVIHDPSTGTSIAESSLIAEYLDKTYPDAPALFPPGTKGLQSAFLAAHRTALGALWQLIMPVTATILNPPSQVYFKATKFGPHLVDLILSGKEKEEQFSKLKEGFDILDELLRKEEGPFVMGENATFTDLAMAGYVLWMKKVWGEDSAEWTEVKGWHMGRWSELLTNLEKYETIL
ncbi:hypothetical protein BDZ94DRAFT_1257439 [Collybia nuda]|uniref:GST N-terminal domain-containing protein n=1 Tax=Collybia nuda TaxID=64659 RepID=A0A9P5Y8C2_9AGAR|nr:hypothetical protein BDZ94DRAFT_1257439 [Collybia nuda]